MSKAIGLIYGLKKHEYKKLRDFIVKDNHRVDNWKRIPKDRVKWRLHGGNWPGRSSMLFVLQLAVFTMKMSIEEAINAATANAAYALARH